MYLCILWTQFIKLSLLVSCERAKRKKYWHFSMWWFLICCDAREGNITSGNVVEYEWYPQLKEKKWAQIVVKLRKIRNKKFLNIWKTYIFFSMTVRTFSCILYITLAKIKIEFLNFFRRWSMLLIPIVMLQLHEFGMLHS